MVAIIAPLSSRKNTPRTSLRKPKSRTRKTVRHALESLEQRTLLSTLVVYGGLADSTHFNTLQDALTVAVNGDTIQLQPGFSSGPDATVTINKSITLTSSGVGILPFDLRLDGEAVTLNNLSVLNLTVGGHHHTVTDCSINQVTLSAGTHNNTFTHNNIAGLTALGGLNSGHDSFVNNAFSGGVSITGNSSGSTEDSFSNNNFNVNLGNALTLEHASGTSVSNNTFNDASAFAFALSIHNSENVLITGNTINTTGMQGTGVYATSDGSASTSLNLLNNSIHSGDGYGVYLAKYNTTAHFEASLQGNDLTSNMFGVFIFGDGSSAGSVDLGNGSTHFGHSTGGNNFSSFLTADASHYAIGLFATTGDFRVPAAGNTFAVADAHSVVADATHTLAAFGSGIIDLDAVLPPPPPVDPPVVPPVDPPPVIPPVIPPTPDPAEAITLNASNFTLVQTACNDCSVAHFTDNKSHKARDFTATITWPDGTTSTGRVVMTRSGGFEVLSRHRWNTAGSFNFTVVITSNTGATATAQGAVTVTPRKLKLTSTNLTTDRQGTACFVVATLTDNLRQCGHAYVASVAWSDGTTSTAVVCRNCDGTMNVKTSRPLTPGTYVGTVSVSTLDGMFSATTSFTLTVKAPTPPAARGRGKP